MERFRALAEELFGGIDTTAMWPKTRRQGAGIFARDEKAAGKGMNAVPPDVFSTVHRRDRFVHRRAVIRIFTSWRISARASAVTAQLSRGARKPRIWDP